MSRRVTACVLLLCWCAQPASAQVLGTGVLPVHEVGAQLVQNTITAAQSTISAVENVIQTAAALEELVPLDEILTVQGIIEDLALLATIVEQAEGLSYDVQSLQAQIAALFDLETAPASTSELQVRLAEIRRVRAQSYAYAMRLQTLLMTAIRTIEHLTLLLNSVAAFIGNKQGIQTLVQVNMTISKTATIHATQTAAFQRAGSVDKMEEVLTVESLHRINEATMADWPTR